MTPRLEERIRNKIKRIKTSLATDKKKWGGFYRDSQGLRYLPTQLYIQLGDFSGGLKYINWFVKNFPDDSGYPDFLFECTIILFTSGKIRDAEKMAFQCFMSNTYVFDQFWGKTMREIDTWEGSNLAQMTFAIDQFMYFHTQEHLVDFAAWLDKLTQTEKFARLMDTFINIIKQLKSEHDTKKRTHLLTQASRLGSDFF